VKHKAKSQDDDEGTITDDALDSILEPEEGDDDPDDEELEAQAEVDKDREASDAAEIEDLVREVEEDVQFFVGAADGALGCSALLKDHKACQTYLPQPAPQGRPCNLLHLCQDRTKVDQAISPDEIEFGCGDDRISVVPLGATGPTCRDRST
jgi:hypothetical protein